MSDNFNNTLGSNEAQINNPEINKEGKNEIKAISNASQALEIAKRLEFNDRDRDIRRARNLAAFNGAAPYSDRSLKEKGQSYRYNVSSGFMEGVIGRGTVPYNELTVNFKDLTEVEADLNDEKKSIVQQEFGNIVEEWGKWPKSITRLNQDLVLNGYNNFIWPTDYDPFPIFVQQKDGFVDEGTLNGVEDLQCFVWKKPYLISELYRKIEEPDVAAKAGWDVENTRTALNKAAPKNIWDQNASSSGMWTAVESAIRGGTVWASIIGAKMIQTYHVLASELDGSVTHYIVVNDGRGEGDNSVLLFKKENRFKSFRDMLVYFDLENGDGTWHGSKGLAQRTFNTHKANDKLICSLLDQAASSGLTIIQPGDQASQDELSISVVGPFACIPNGIQINSTTLPSVAPTSFQLQALLTSTVEQRIGDVIPESPSAQTGNSKTATEAKINAGRQQMITKGNLKRYVDPISQTLSIMLRRLLKENSQNEYAKRFQERLINKGVSREDMKKIEGARNTGRIDDVLGNTSQNTQVIFSEFRNDPQIDQEDLKRMRISSVLDSDAADELIISDKDQTRLIESQRLAEFAITSIMAGFPEVPVSPRDNHEVILQTVLQWLGAHIQQQGQQGLNPDTLPLVKQIIAFGAKNLQFLQGDPSKKQAFHDMSQRLKMAVDTVKQLEAQSQQLAQKSLEGARALAKTPEEHAQVQQLEQQIQAKQNPQ